MLPISRCSHCEASRFVLSSCCRSRALRHANSSSSCSVHIRPMRSRPSTTPPSLMITSVVAGDADYGIFTGVVVCGTRKQLHSDASLAQTLEVAGQRARHNVAETSLTALGSLEGRALDDLFQMIADFVPVFGDGIYFGDC